MEEVILRFKLFNHKQENKYNANSFLNNICHFTNECKFKRLLLLLLQTRLS